MGRGTSGQAYETPRRPGEAPGTSGRPREAREGPWDVGFLGCPKGFPGPPWALRTSQELPGVSVSFSLVSGRPRDFSRPPRAARTSEGLPRAPWDVRMSQGGSPGLLGVSYACPEVSQTGMTDPIPPVSEAAAVPAHQRHVSVSVLWFETFVAVPPSVVHNGLFGVRELCVLFFILFATEPFRLVKHLPNTHIQNPPLPSNT